MKLLRYFGLMLVLLTVAACVDPEALTLVGTVDVIVVDGTITNLAEPQVIKLNRSRADPLTGRFGVFPLTKLSVQVVVDSAQVIECHETVDGTYQLPSDFKGQVGHSYQLRFTLADGKQYVSNQQIMPAVPPIDRVTKRFNPTSLPPNVYTNNVYYTNFRSGYDIEVDVQDPATERNFYRWDWRLYEKQKWCRSCYQTNYVDTVGKASLQNGVYTFYGQPVEDCIKVGAIPNGDYHADYTCRTQCWDILYSYTVNIFDDQFANGAPIAGRNVAQVPLFTRQPALLELRQLSLSYDAYRYYNLFQQQTQNTGGLADTPPTALVGNVRNTANARERVIGFFTASAVVTTRIWLDKKDATTLSMGAYDDAGNIVQFDDELFYVENHRVPAPGAGCPPGYTRWAGPFHNDTLLSR